MKLRLLVASVLVARAGAAQTPTWHSRMTALIRDTILPNGLTLIVAENHTVPLMTASIAFRTGAIAQQPGDEGMAHLTEHLLFRAYGEDQAFAGDVAAMNGTYNGTTSDEEVRYYITAPAKQLSPALRAIAKLVRDPKLNKRDLDAERKVVGDELARDNSSEESVLRTALGTRLWSGLWSKKDPGGSQETVNKITLERIKASLADQYVPGNAAVIITGDVSMSDALTEVTRAFGDWKGSTPPSHPISDVALASTQTVAVSAPATHLMTLSFQWLGPSVSQSPRDVQAGEVFSEMVNSNLSSAIPRLIASGVIHSLAMVTETRHQRSALTLTALVSPAGFDQAVTALKNEIDRFATPAYLNDSLLIVGKSRVAIDEEHWIEAESSLAETIAHYWCVADLGYVRDRGDAISKVDLPMLQSFVSKYVVGQPMVVGVLAPAADADRAGKTLTTVFGGKP